MAGIPFERWELDAVSKPEVSNAVRFGGFLYNVDRFDNAIFSTSPTEAALMDPQQRLLLAQCLQVGAPFACTCDKRCTP